MFRSQLRCLSLLAAAVACGAGSLGPQLRGSSVAAPAPAPAQGEPIAVSQLQHTDCGCNDGICTCVHSSSSLSEAEEQQQLEQSLLNHTQALDAWWREQQTEQMQCSCPGGGDACQCEHDTGNEMTEDVDDALRNKTEQLLSLWWVAHGGGYHGRYRRGWGYRPRCGHVGYSGCGCGYYGCRCGHAGYTGCR